MDMDRPSGGSINKRDEDWLVSVINVPLDKGKMASVPLICTRDDIIGLQHTQRRMHDADCSVQ